ncbi:MAG TPA: hypothetical protein GX507_02300 [Clostridia bacterium]|nr:hypothetical protein [Clostridia bacterium]
MKKFFFRLERVLSLKRQLEKEASMRVREAEGWRQRALNEVDSKRRAQKEFSGLFFAHFEEGRFQVMGCESYRMYFERLAKDRAKAEETLMRITKMWEERRESLIRATKAMKVLERLRESQREMYEKGVMYKEQVAADDAVAGRKAKQDIA